jgi:hypothetical protein
MANIEIKIPITQTGEYDLEKQKQVANKYETLYRMQQQIIDYLQELAEVVIRI